MGVSGKCTLFVFNPEKTSHNAHHDDDPVLQSRAQGGELVSGGTTPEPASFRETV